MVDHFSGGSPRPSSYLAFFYESYCIQAVQLMTMPSFLLDYFSGFHICSRPNPLPYNPARYPGFTKPPQLLGSRPSYVPVIT